MKKFIINFFIFLSLSASAFDDFLITDIRIIGLQRVSIGSIFTAIPVSVGDTMNQEKYLILQEPFFLLDSSMIFKLLETEMH